MGSSETSVNFYQTTRRHLPEDRKGKVIPGVNQAPRHEGVWEVEV
jgi:hypothetical protein